MTSPSAFSLRRQILLVDDDAPFLESLAKLFDQWSKGAWEIHLATNTARALAIIDEQSLDLLVIDVQMPVVDGVQFLQLVHRRFPGLSKAVFTGFGGEEVRATCLNNGADLYLEKPLNPDGLASAFAALNELAAWQPQEGFRGLLRQVGLSDVLQMECLAKNSSVLEVISESVRGRIFIENGAIVHAEAGSEKGQAAFARLFGLAGGTFSLKPYSEPPLRSIDAHWEVLVMEAARQVDEAAEHRAATAGVPGVSAPDPESARTLEAFGNAAATAPDPSATLPLPDGEHRRIDEVMVCSTRGEVLYAWQCRDIESRLKLIQYLEQTAELITQRVPVGSFDRAEMDGPAGRVVAQFQADRKVWVHANHAPPHASKGGSP